MCKLLNFFFSTTSRNIQCPRTISASERGGTGGGVWFRGSRNYLRFYTDDMRFCLAAYNVIFGSSGSISDGWIASRLVSSLSHKCTTGV